MSYLRQAKGMLHLGKSVEEICREMGVTPQVYFRLLDAERNRKLRALEGENAKLKTLLACYGHAEGQSLMGLPQ